MTTDVAHIFNGCSKDGRQGHVETSTTPRFLSTIDFGTTYCSVAYLLRPDLSPNPSEVDPTVLKLDNARNRRVPNCILFDPNGRNIAFGHEAREQYADLNRDRRPLYHYFEHVKRDLRHEENLDRNQKISAMNDKQFFLLDVIAHVLHHLKCRLLTVLRDFGYKELKASEFDWVITVPAIWKPRAKRLMLEAGHMAGLCSDLEPSPLSIATEVCRPLINEQPPEKLSLALEPQSAAMHCQHKAKVVGKGLEYVVRPERYLVVDIGGGTVDIASHSTVEGCIVEIVPPVGNFWGGITVNEEFSKFLEDFVDDPEFSRYIVKCSPENRARHKVDLTELIYTRFEKLKRRFGSLEGFNSYIIEFPRSFLRMYQGFLVEKGSARNSDGEILVEVEEDGAVMRIYNSKMKEFFQPAMDGIMNLIESHLEKNNFANTIDTIYWVGGFGGCKYLRSQLETTIGTKFEGCTYQFPVPPEPELAVVLGAHSIRCNPGIVPKRRLGADDFDQALPFNINNLNGQRQQQQSGFSHRTPLLSPTTSTASLGKETGDGIEPPEVMGDEEPKPKQNQADRETERSPILGVPLQYVEFLHLMQKGTELTEVKKTQPRTYHLDDDLLGVTVTWKSTVFKKTKEDKIPILQVKEVREGVTRANYPKERCFTIIYTEGRRSRILELMAHDPADADAWMQGLNFLVNKECRSHDQQASPSLTPPTFPGSPENETDNEGVQASIPQDTSTPHRADSQILGWPSEPPTPAPPMELPHKPSTSDIPPVPPHFKPSSAMSHHPTKPAKTLKHLPVLCPTCLCLQVRNGLVNKVEFLGLIPQRDCEIELAQHRRGFLRKKVTIANMLSWTNDPIKQPMIVTRDKQQKKDAVEMFKLVLQYMGDRKSKVKDVNEIALEITTMAWEKEGLRDELFIQLCRQTTDNSNPSSLARGWELFAIGLVFFPPSSKFQSYLEGYFSKHIEPKLENKGVQVEVFAQYCHKHIEQMAQTGATKGVKKPTIEEIAHAKDAPLHPSMFGTTLSLEDVMEIQSAKFPD